MDKQKKTILFALPIVIAILLIIFGLIIKSFQRSEQETKGTINTDIPDVSQQIEENKITAYQNENIYKEKNDNISDFKLLLEPATDTLSPIITPDKKEGSENNSPSHYQKVKKQFNHEIKKTNNEYGELLKEGNDNQSESQPIQVIDQKHNSVTFNSTTIKFSDKINKVDNQLRAVIHSEQVVVNHSKVKLRTTQSFRYQNKLIPANTFLLGICTFSSGGRVLINIRSIPFLDGSLACGISVYDLDGFPGIDIQKNIEVESGRKTVASSSRKIGSTFSTAIKAVAGNNLAGELASVAGENVIKGITDGVSEKTSLNKAILSNNYRVILKIEK